MALTILLDDSDSTSENPSSRLYENHLHAWVVHNHVNALDTSAAILSCLDEITASRDRGEFIVSAFAYELGSHFKGVPAKKTGHPLIQAWSFKELKTLSKGQVDEWLDARLEALDPQDQVAGILDIQKSIEYDQFKNDIDRILDYIRSGDAYQINHTYRIHGQTYGSPLALYQRLRGRQPVRFGAYVENDDQYILSLSPELFIQRKGDLIQAMPMKGTANALVQSPSSLSEDLKNQAENVMIVDLLRNDLSQLATPNGVSVPSLFDVQRHGDVLQMTSTIHAVAKIDLSIREILDAVFPCGSVTGAPKKRSMEIIRELESANRDYYCGAIGWFDPSGDFALSVPIRTVEIEREARSRLGHFVLGVGAGITIDSDPKAEWEECRVKSSFLIDLPSPTGIFETISVIGGQAQRLDRHLDRMTHSAMLLNIPFDRIKAKGLISSACNSLDVAHKYRIRIDLSPAGEQSITKGLLEELPSKVKLCWAKDILSNPTSSVLNSCNPLLRHKISDRQIYDEAWQAAVQNGGFDALFTNETGYVTEGGRSNIFIKHAGSKEWLTPPISAGVLPGVMRSSILSNPNWNAREINLSPDDVLSAEEIIVTNSLRGSITAYIE
jgi:para-aminobenzoate synthetase / 4-amino-4-deoxychorismate lyase